MSTIPFETLSIAAAEAEAFVSGFDRPEHSALIVGPYFEEEFAEFADDFQDPYALIAAARKLRVESWLRERTAALSSFDASMGSMMDVMMGRPLKDPGPDASEAAQRLFSAQQAIRGERQEDAPPFIRELEKTLEDASALMEAPGGDPLADVMDIMERLQKVNEARESLDDNMRVIQTLGQFFMGQQVAMMTGGDEGDDPSDEIFSKMTEGRRAATPVGETTIAILPVDDTWAALAWMQQGNYAQGDFTALLAVARAFGKDHGARPVSATSDSIRFALPKPVRDPEPMLAAFGAMGATEINECDPATAAGAVADATEWLIWWD